MMRTSIVFWGSLALAGLGVWKIIEPSAAGYTGDSVAYWSDIVGGALVIVLGLWSAIDRGPGTTYGGTLRKAAPTLGIVAIGIYGVVVSFADYYDDIGRIDTFYVMALSMALLVLGLLITRSRLTEFLRESAPSCRADAGRPVGRPSHA
jgi:peptidoglycan/LPS O-acetylase OafA/YrhL